MELGQRLRQARLEKGLSQRQVCGEEITRNMLSQIENGSARPSMTTLQYLAGQLGKPMSYFLEEQDRVFPDAPVLEKASSAYAQGQYKQVLLLLEECSGELSPEGWLLKALSLMELARQAVREEMLPYARSLLEQAEQAGTLTPYYTAAQERERLLLMYSAGVPARELAHRLPEDHRELLLLAQAALDAGEEDQSDRFLDAVRSRDAQWHFQKGQIAFARKDYAVAAEHFLLAEEEYPQACAQLEQCYRELEDYKKAYYYACKQRQK